LQKISERNFWVNIIEKTLVKIIYRFMNIRLKLIFDIVGNYLR
jgi:hypothetical protein